MKVFLIPCSKKKVEKESGGAESALDRSVLEMLSPAYGQKLLAAREDILRLISKGALIEGSSCIPAFERYNGNLYQKAKLTHEDATGRSPSGGQILIVSALYGLLAASEPIQKYDLEMENTFDDDRKVFNFWEENKLGAIVRDALGNCGATVVHDLLTKSYRKALSPWPPENSFPPYRPHNYPGRGIGALYDRGADLRKLLDEKGC